MGGAPLQYKVLKIAREQKSDYELAFTMENLREDQKALLNPGSAFVFGLLNESKLIDLLKIVGMTPGKVREIKLLVRNRNDNLAHAKGGIEQDPNERIDQYLDALRTLQPYLVLHNDRIADQWLNEISAEDDLNEYVDTHLLDSQLCPTDFRSGMLAVFNLNEDTPFEEWKAAVSKALTTGSQQGVLWLQHIAQKHYDNSRRFVVTQMVNDWQNKLNLL